MASRVDNVGNGHATETSAVTSGCHLMQNPVTSRCVLQLCEQENILPSCKALTSVLHTHYIFPSALPSFSKPHTYFKIHSIPFMQLCPFSWSNFFPYPLHLDLYLLYLFSISNISIVSTPVIDFVLLNLHHGSVMHVPPFCSESRHAEVEKYRFGVSLNQGFDTLSLSEIRQVVTSPPIQLPYPQAWVITTGKGWCGD